MKNNARTSKKKDTQELINQIKQAKLLSIFDSTGMNQTQVMVYLLEQSHKIIKNKGFDIDFKDFVDHIKSNVKYRSPFNMIKAIMPFVLWGDNAGTYDYTTLFYKTFHLTVQELVEQLKECDPNAIIVLGDNFLTATPYKCEPTEMFMLKDQSNNKLVYACDFHENIKDKMQPVVVFDVPSEIQQANKRTVPYAKFFSRTQDTESNVIKWLFETTQADIKNCCDLDTKIDIMPLMSKATNIESALEILDQYIEWIDIDNNVKRA